MYSELLNRETLNQHSSFCLFIVNYLDLIVNKPLRWFSFFTNYTSACPTCIFVSTTALEFNSTKNVLGIISYQQRPHHYWPVLIFCATLIWPLVWETLLGFLAHCVVFSYCSLKLDLRPVCLLLPENKCIIFKSQTKLQLGFCSRKWIKV